MNTSTLLANTHNSRALYRTIWRWHFYAGICCIPFVILLSITGAMYLFKPYYESWQERHYHQLPESGVRLTGNEQIQAAINAIPNGKFLSYRLPQAANESVLINVRADNNNWQVFINPYTGAVVGKQETRWQLMNIVKTLHGELLLGTAGSILVELAACWAIVLVVSGVYLWWPRHANGMAGVMYPRLHEGKRTFWRDLHAVTGIWISLLALFLLATGLPWALVWGTALKEVRAIDFSQQQDWAQNRAQEHQHWRAQASDVFDLTPDILATAEYLQLAPPVELSLDDPLVNRWKASSQTQNRPQRSDFWINNEGSIDKQSRFSDKNIIDKVIGVGIAAHEGYLFGWFNLLLGVLTCAGLILISVSGLIVWRRRKPEGALGAPPPMPTSVGTMVITITIGLALLLPLMALSLCALFAFEYGVCRRSTRLAQWMGLPLKS